MLPVSTSYGQIECRVRTEIDVPVSVAYNCYSDREAIPRWMPFISSVKVPPYFTFLLYFFFFFLLLSECPINQAIIDCIKDSKIVTFDQTYVFHEECVPYRVHVN